MHRAGKYCGELPYCSCSAGLRCELHSEGTDTRGQVKSTLKFMLVSCSLNFSCMFASFNDFLVQCKSETNKTSETPFHFRRNVGSLVPAITLLVPCWTVNARLCTIIKYPPLLPTLETQVGF